jgi:hypothetical protein
VLLSQVNDEWCKGSIRSSEGMFPLSYVRIDVRPEPPCEQQQPTSPSNRVVALYAFAAETDQDLSLKVTTKQNCSWMDVQSTLFEKCNNTLVSGLVIDPSTTQEGDIIRVIESVGNGWLYGENCQSCRRGQFPESFVRRELN